MPAAVTILFLGPVFTLQLFYYWTGFGASVLPWTLSHVVSNITCLVRPVLLLGVCYDRYLNLVMDRFYYDVLKLTWLIEAYVD